MDTTVILCCIALMRNSVSFIRRGDHRLRVLEKGVLRIYIHEYKSQNGLAKIHNDELSNLYPYPKIFLEGRNRRMRSDQKQQEAKLKTKTLTSILFLS
jgi:hypothetical protein